VRDRRRPLFAANWKMYMGPREVEVFISKYTELFAPRDDATVVIFPPSISLVSFAMFVEGRPDLEFGVQDVHTEVQGAHTGAISAAMVSDTRATWGLAGHSERRSEFGDEDAMVGIKLGRLFDAGLQPILCVGETIEEREGGRLSDVLGRQIRGALEPLSEDARRELVYAYEPVWAIGTGHTATPSDASESHAIVREMVAKIVDNENAETVTILYGGSVKPENIEELIMASGVDGVLVGGASLGPESWATICDCGR
jgi:triosephosphate isomerase